MNNKPKNKKHKNLLTAIVLSDDIEEVDRETGLQYLLYEENGDNDD